MNTVRRCLLCFLVLLVLQGSNAQAQRGTAATKERFDNLLPQAMRENNIDMWIH